MVLSGLTRVISPCKGAGRPDAEQLTAYVAPELSSMSLRLLTITALVSFEETIRIELRDLPETQDGFYDITGFHLVSRSELRAGRHTHIL